MTAGRPAGAPVIVLNWNGWEDTFQCLTSLSACEDVREVWLVDNGSDVDRTGTASQIYSGLRVLRWSENYGFAGGYNRALRLALAEGYLFAYLLNNDCIVVPGFLGTVIGHAMSDPRIAAVGSCIVYASSPQHALFDGSYHSIGERRFEPFGLRSVRNVNGAGMLIRLETMETCGQFDERFFCYGEETDWCWRMLDAGWAIVTSGGSIIHHRREGSDRNMNALYYRTRNQFLYLERLSLGRRWFWRLRLVWQAASNAYSAYRDRRNDWLTMGTAVRDALLGRFGKRQSEIAPVSSRLLLALGWLRALTAPRIS